MPALIFRPDFSDLPDEDQPAGKNTETEKETQMWAWVCCLSTLCGLSTSYFSLGKFDARDNKIQLHGRPDTDTLNIMDLFADLLARITNHSWLVLDLWQLYTGWLRCSPLSSPVLNIKGGVIVRARVDRTTLMLRSPPWVMIGHRLCCSARPLSRFLQNQPKICRKGSQPYINRNLAHERMTPSWLLLWRL